MNQDPTLTAYRIYAARAIGNWKKNRSPSKFLRHFAKVIPKGKRLLDYGCGIGEELAWLNSKGFQVDGIDATKPFVLEARRRCPAAKIQLARFETVALPKQYFDGIWCNAALIHLSRREIASQLHKLHQALKPTGVLGLTLIWGTSSKIHHNDWIPGRHFTGYQKSTAQALMRRWGPNSLKVVASDGKHGRWIQILARKQ